jgi:phosphinothricin acetyltransferase
MHIRKHVGEMGIIVRKEARGMGLGARLFKETMEKGIKEFKLRIVVLDVFKKNKIAQGLYKKMGFKEVGIIKNGVQYYKEFADSVLMAKHLK